MSLFDHFADIFLTRSTIASERFEILKHQGEIDRVDDGYIEKYNRSTRAVVCQSATAVV